MSTGTLSVPVTPVTMSTKSPALMTVPTPVTWSTWTAMRDVAGRDRDVADLAAGAREDVGGDGLALDDAGASDLADDQAVELDAVGAGSP